MPLSPTDPSTPPPPASHPGHRRAGKPRRPRGATLLLAALLAAGGGGPGLAHDWPSPSPGPVSALPTGNAAPHWSGMLWPGPAAGEPAAPSARDCRRAPRAVDLPGPALLQAPAESAGTAWGRPRRGDGRAVAGAHESMRAEAAGASSAALSPAAPSVAPSVDGSGRPIAAEAAAQRSADRAGRPEQLPDPVTAGVVDDNADFGRYLDFRARQAGLPARPMDVGERYRLVVHDAAGRPVPDAQVRVLADGRVLPLWARTDAGGQVWLHPRSGAAFGPDAPAQPAGWPAPDLPPLLEVQVRQGEGEQALHGSALLQRGQRHDLQVRLDGRAATGPARLDLVFLVDATGSMADEIHKLAASMRAMADQIARLPSRPDLCFGLVAYRDQGDAFYVRAQDFSDDLDAFQRSLAALRADGGGDYPEALNEGLHTAVHRLSWRGDGATRLVVLLADAPPHVGERALPGQPRYDHDLRAALARGIKLLAVGASGLDPLGEVVLRQAAQFTGGRFVFLTYARADDPASGPGRETVHQVENYSVESLDRLVVRLVREELARRPG